MGNNFKSRKVGEENNTKQNKKKIFLIIKFIVILLCLSCVVFAGKYLIKGGEIALGYLGKTTAKTVSKKFGEEMKKDDYGNINVLLVGIGGEKHQGGYLSDTIIVASWNQDLGAITMISVPRDLYVSGSGYVGRINGIFSRAHSKGGTLGSGAQALSEKLQEILGVDIPYYAVVDFQGFKDVVDTLGGVEIYVPETITDTEYPDNNLGYETFHISAGLQVLDGDTALKYARSRHTTSDFSRSERQQLLIKAIVNTMLQSGNITNIDTIRNLYDTYTEMVTTNISVKEMIGAIRFIPDFDNIYSFGLNTHCTYSSYNLTDVGCFLYNGNRDQFNGASVILPNGSTAGNVSVYDVIQNFAFFVIHNQGYLLESPRIIVKNAIDKNYASGKGKSVSGWANKIAVKMKKYGFKVIGTENMDEMFDQTTAIVYGNQYPETIRMLNKFLPINVVNTGEIINNCIEGDLSCDPEERLYDMELIIGNDFIDYVLENPFNYEK